MDAVVRIGADVQQALRGIDQLNRRLEGIQSSSVKSAQSMKALEGAAGRVSAALTTAATAFAGFAATKGLQSIVNATQRMEGFRTQLTTYLGSQQLANAELKRLSDLAKTLPQDVDELTQAFIIFQRFGIDTSNESMKAFSNIASANSKSIVQFGEAVADALTGEFERLKEFGIKVSTENGKYTARIGEDQVAVATSTTLLVEKLKELGAEGGRFGGTTVGPLTMALSNFRGAIFETSAALGSGGLGLAIADTVNQLTDLITKNDEASEAFGDRLTKGFLYAKEAAILLFDNIELIAKAFAILIGIKIVTWVAGAVAAFGSFAFTIGKALLPALVFLGKALKATAILALRHPLIGGIALIVGGIEYLTGAVSGLAEKFGLIGDDSMLDSLLDDAKGLANQIAGPIINGMDQFFNIGQRVDEQFASIKSRAEKTTEALDEATAAAERQRIAAEAAARAEQQKGEQIREILANRLEETRISGLTAEEQTRIKLEKELTNKFGEKAVANAKGELDEYIKQTRELQIQNAIRDRSRQLAKDALQGTIISVLQEQEAIDGIKKAYEELGYNLKGYQSNLHGEMINLETVFQIEMGNLRTANVQRINDKIKEIELERIRNLQTAEQGAIANNMREYDRQILQRIGNEERQRQIVNDRIEFEKKSETEKAAFAIDQGAQMFSALGAQNKKAFEAAKAFNIANAIMNTYMAATKALATYPPPFNFIAAAAAIGMGLAQVAQIRSQQYSGRQLGGPVMGGQSYIVGENGPEMFTPNTTGSITRNGDLGGQNVNVTFNINAVDAQGVDDLLLQRRGLITQLISDAMTDRGQRSML